MKMPRYSRSRYSSRYRSYRRGWRRYYRRKFRRTFLRYVNGSSRSSLRMKCSQTLSYNASSGHGSDLGNVLHCLPYDGTTTMSVVHNPLYQAYRNLYEETKLIGMKVQVCVTSVVGNATLPSLEIYTAWDRRHGRGEADPTAAELKAMATSNVATALNNNVAKISRSIYASDLMEKAQWHDSEPRVAGSDETDDAWYTAGKNPNFFCPAFFFAFGSPSLAADTQVNYTVSITYYVAFRNPRYGGSSLSKDLPSRSVSFPDMEFETLDDDDGDMDTKIGDAELETRTAALRTARLTSAATARSEQRRAEALEKLMGDKVIQKR